MNRGDEPAYPVVGPDGVQHSGLTIREAAAIAALSGLLACPGSISAAGKMADENNKRIGNVMGDLAVSYADALIDELEKSRE